MKAALECAPLRALGRWSYSIYMVHFIIAVIIMNVVDHVWKGHVEIEGFAEVTDLAVWTGDGLVFVYLGVVIRLSALTYSLIEKPWRDCGRRLARTAKDDASSPASARILTASDR